MAGYYRCFGVASPQLSLLLPGCVARLSHLCGAKSVTGPLQLPSPSFVVLQCPPPPSLEVDASAAGAGALLLQG